MAFLNKYPFKVELLTIIALEVTP